MNQSNFKLKWNFYFLKYDYFTWKPQFWHDDLIWKEKYEFPTIEYIPEFGIKFLKWEIGIQKGTTKEWEFLIWLTKFCNNDLQKALEKWPWKKLN